MKLNRKIKRAIVLAAWLLVAAGITTLLVAANNKDQEHNCKRVVVSIGGDGAKYYIDKHDILGQIKFATNGGVVSKPVAQVNLEELEQMLEKQTWIQDAELYFDSRDVLHVVVTERDPIARVFNTAGNSFYIDSSGQRMPLLDKVSARLPVITGFTTAKKLNGADSAILKGVKAIAQFVIANEFWNAQIAQVDITPAGTFELVPVVGNHIIRIGTAENLQEKLDRLYLFYKQVLSKTGFDKYAVIDVQFKDQVLGVKERTVSGVDSLQLQKNLKELMERSRLRAVEDSAAAERSDENAVAANAPAEKAEEKGPQANENKTEPIVARPKPEVQKNKISNVVEKPKNTKPAGHQPKAVMPKRSN